MFYKFGRICQILGLIILPIAIAGNLHDENSVTLWQSMGMSGLGVLIFSAGWLIQRWSTPAS